MADTTTVKIYRVGGCVRDEIMGVQPKDIDYSVEAESFEAMRQHIVDSGGEIFLETPQYYTIRAKVPEIGAADFVLCRKDGTYKNDGRRPDYVEAGTLYDDLARRDFTMNAIAVSTDGMTIDPFDGRWDIAHKLIRCVGSPQERFEEDALRMLRAIRFSITKGFNLHRDIENCLTNLYFTKKLSNISLDRQREELHKCFKADTFATLQLLEKYYLLKAQLFNVGNGLWLEPTLAKR